MAMGILEHAIPPVLSDTLWPAPRQRWRKDESFYDLLWGREILVSMACFGEKVTGQKPWAQKNIL
jgi:hypothetical protein